jgi:LacI family transcriptional regulator
MAKMTIDKVAELSHVSRSVVSRVLNDHPNVSDAARERVRKVIEEYDYRPSSVARSLATSSTHEICALTPRREGDALANGFWPLLHSGILDQGMEREYLVSLSMVGLDGDASIEQFIDDQRFDGYILITQQVSRQVGAALEERDVPTVLIGHDPTYQGFSSVDVNNHAGAYEATMHLCDLGHETVGAIWGTPGLKESVDRRAGYLDALSDADRDVPDEWIAVGDYSQESGYTIMSEWLQDRFAPTALFCASDTMATGALLALYEAGCTVPDDVAVVGFDGLPTSRYTVPPLTTVCQPIYEKGARAANIIIDQIDTDPSEVEHVNLDPKLVVRQSCGGTT